VSCTLTEHIGPLLTQHDSRFSLPFFFNATATVPMAVVPTCQSPDNPPKYPAVSYLDGQGVVQGE
jgi:hypothetical protein